MKKRGIILAIIILFIVSIFIVSNNRKYESKIERIVFKNQNIEINDNNYIIDDTYIKRVSTFTPKPIFYNSFSVKRGTLEAKCENDSAYIGTGCQLLINYLDNTTRYSAIVNGDTNGDGTLSITDIVKTVDNSNLNNEQKIAADINNDKKIDNIDYQTMGNYLLLNQILPLPAKEQTKPSFSLDVSNLSLSKGESKKINITMNQTGLIIIKWSSSNTNVAKVDNNGNVTAVGTGNATITATAANGDEYSAYASVDVTSPVTGVSLNTNDVILQIGQTQQLTATITPFDATNKTITWQSSNNNVVKVNDNGLIIAVSKGNAIVTATTANGKTASATVTVQDNLKITLTSSDDNVLLAGDTVTYTLSYNSLSNYSYDQSKIHIYTQSEIDYKLYNYTNYTITQNNTSLVIRLKVPSTPDQLGLLRLVFDEGAVYSDGNKSNAVTRDDYVVSLNLNAAAYSNNSDYGEGTAAIAAAVGVDNSFYVKDYTFAINNKVVESNSTTNAYTFTKNENGNDLSNGTTYSIKAIVEIYSDRLIRNSNNELYSSKTGIEATVQSLSNDTITGTVIKSIKVPTNVAEQLVEYDFIDVSESGTNSADSIYISTKNTNILIDTGNASTQEGEDSSHPDAQQISKYIKEKRGSSNCVIDYLILSHNDGDHTGGFESIVNDKCTVKNVVVSTSNYTGYDGRYKIDGSNIGMKAIALAKSKGINIITVQAGNVLQIDGLILDVYNPYNPVEVKTKWLATTDEKGMRPLRTMCNGITVGPCASGYDSYEFNNTIQNNSSIVFRTMYGNRRTYLGGDASFFAEEIMLGKAYTTSGLKVMTKSSVTTKGGEVVKFKDTNVSLLNDIAAEEGISTNDVINKYKLNRLTEKNLKSNNMKLSHHGYINANSVELLEAIHPARIISTQRKYESKNFLTNTGLYSPYTNINTEAKLKKYYSGYEDYNFFTSKASSWQSIYLIPRYYTDTQGSVSNRGYVSLSTYGRTYKIYHGTYKTIRTR